MSAKTPIRATFTGSDVTGLAEYQSGEFKSLEEIKKKRKKEAIFTPKNKKNLRTNVLKGWQKAIIKTLA